MASSPPSPQATHSQLSVLGAYGLLRRVEEYSENTCHQSACYRYAEVGCAYCDSLNQCGLSAQCARFRQGTEHSVELTYRRQLNRHIALQPSFQYINNTEGNFTALCARLYYSF
ncbi:carbohydrate porin [Leyella stercorea]